MGGSPGLQTNSTQLIVKMIHPAFCGMGGDVLTRNNMKCKSSVDDGIGCIRDVRCGVCSALPSHVIAKLTFLPPTFYSSFSFKIEAKENITEWGT
jgi:hypothetical protein